MPAVTNRPRISRQEALRRQEHQRQVEEKRQESRELAKGPIDVPFCLLVLLLTGVGLVMLLSASFPSAYYETDGANPLRYFIRQGIFADLLVLVLIPGIGQTRNHATRWIGVGSLTFQPSEVAKMAIVLYFSDTISRKKDKMRDVRVGVAPYLVWMALIAVLMLLEPHLSGTVLILGTGAVLMFVGGIQWRWVAMAVGFAGSIAYLMFKGVITYGQSRIAMWLDPFIDPRGDGYQLSQSLISIGSGGVWGLGFGKSRQKFLYLPEEHNDFIFAIVCEELGLVGASIIMLLFMALILRGYWIALHARDRFGSLLVVGITTLIAMQTILNIAVVTGSVPTTGISLPFFSYGGTALAMQLGEMGIVLSVSRQMKPTKSG